MTPQTRVQIADRLLSNRCKATESADMTSVTPMLFFHVLLLTLWILMT